MSSRLRMSTRNLAIADEYPVSAVVRISRSPVIATVTNV